MSTVVEMPIIPWPAASLRPSWNSVVCSAMPSFAQPVPSFATATAFLSVAGEPLVGLEINVVGHDQHFYKKKNRTHEV